MPRLSLYLLGPPRIERDGVPIKVDTRKAIALLAYLAMTRERHRRDALVNLLWPEYDQSHGRGALRRTLSALKRALAGDWLDIDRENVGLNPDADLWLDVDRFRHHTGQCQAHEHPASEACPTCPTPCVNAVALHRGDFLIGFSLRDSVNFDDWQFFQSEGLRRELAGALERLVHCYSAQGTFEPAIGCARRWLALDRLNEAAHRHLIQLYAWSGRRSAALRQYQECTRVLESQLGVSPQEATTALYRAIVEGRAPPPPTAQGIRRLEGKRADRFSPAPEPPGLPVPGAPPSIVEDEKRVVTVLFVGVSGLMTRLKDISPEDEVSLVRHLLDAIKGALLKHGGQIDPAPEEMCWPSLERHKPTRATQNWRFGRRSKHRKRPRHWV